MKKNCEVCGNEFTSYNRNPRFCSVACYGASRTRLNDEKLVKICNDCKIEKPVSEFYRRKNGVYRWVCSSCHLKRSADYRKKNPERVRARERAWTSKNKEKAYKIRGKSTQKLKLEVFTHYSKGVPRCDCCKEITIEFLSIDHIMGGGNKHRQEIESKSGKRMFGREFYRWLKNNGYPDGYRVLCHNCNLSLGFYKFCPHQFMKDLSGLIVDPVKESSDFDIFSLIPRSSELKSRNDVDISSFLTKEVPLRVPIIASPMSSVCESDLSIVVGNLGGAGIIHRYNTVEEQSKFVKSVKDSGVNICAAAIGTNNVEKRIESLVKSGVNILCLDVAHGDSSVCYDVVRFIKKNFGDEIGIMSGNIITESAAEKYLTMGVETLRIGIGTGLVCTTREVAGVGKNQIQTLRDVAKHVNDDAKLISDGGIRNSGHIVKALAAGADAVMIGSLFAATDKSPAKRIYKSSISYAIYAGMASKYAENERIKRTGENESVIDHIAAPEGRDVLIRDCYKTTAEVFNELSTGIKHGLAYMGAKNIYELRRDAKWQRTDVSDLA